LLYGVCFIDANTGWVVGGSGNGIILHTTDGGTKLDDPINRRGVISTESALPMQIQDGRRKQYSWKWPYERHNFHTIDGGINWTSQQIGAMATYMYDVPSLAPNTETIIDTGSL